MRKPWTKAEDGWLDLLLRPVKIPEVSELLGRAAWDVEKRVLELDLRPRSGSLWKDQEPEIQRLAESGLTMRQAAVKLGRTKRGLQSYCSKRGIQWGRGFYSARDAAKILGISEKTVATLANALLEKKGGNAHRWWPACPGAHYRLTDEHLDVLRKAVQARQRGLGITEGLRFRNGRCVDGKRPRGYPSKRTMAIYQLVFMLGPRSCILTKLARAHFESKPTQQQRAGLARALAVYIKLGDMLLIPATRKSAARYRLTSSGFRLLNEWEKGEVRLGYPPLWKERQLKARGV